MRNHVAGVAVAALLAGCATGTYTPPKETAAPKAHERTVSKSFDQTWTALVEYASGTFFSIDRFEKASGLMTLNFGSSTPDEFIDCGWMKAQALNQTLDQPYAGVLAERWGAKLDGKMNILVKSIDPTSTLVRVNARYIFNLPATPNTPPQQWTFDSGGEATVIIKGQMAGTIPTRTCRPTYKAEQAILDAVAK